MKYLAILFCLLLVGCNTHARDYMCPELAVMQYNEVCKRVGKENARLEQLHSDHPSYTYHLQAMERIPPNESGVWYYIPNYKITVYLSKYPQGKCTPYKRIK